jgi:predicted MPP superfamily phosphohydrolase
VFTGDLVNNEATEFIPYVHLFNSIEAPLGKFSILGNHDYGDYWKWATKEEKEKNLDTLKELQQAAGFKLLLNESVKIEKNGAWIHLLGIENWGDGFAQYGDLEKTLAQVPDEDFKVLLSHDPSHFEYQIKKHPSNINLTLSGHTHGMQMGVEIPGFRWSPVQYRYPRWAGIYRENERILHVNRGFGFLGFRGRVGIWPEITVIELQREA